MSTTLLQRKYIVKIVKTKKKDSDVFTQISKHKYLHEKFCTTEVMCKTQLLIKGCIK